MRADGESGRQCVPAGVLGAESARAGIRFFQVSVAGCVEKIRIEMVVSGAPRRGGHRMHAASWSCDRRHWGACRSSSTRIHDSL